MSSRIARIFISSPYRNCVQERDLLATVVFPEVRRRARDRFFEVISVDWRWGIAEEESQSGATISICLSEIDRARSFFICLLGERHGWAPAPTKHRADLLASLPGLVKHMGWASVTAIDILHGAINDRGRPRQALFFLRDTAWSEGRGPDSAGQRSREREMLTTLKEQIRASGMSVTPYASSESLASRLTEQLWRLIDANYPAAEVPDDRGRESIADMAFAACRRESVAYNARLLADLDLVDAAFDGVAPNSKAGRLVLVRGIQGVGKTTLLTCAASKRRARMQRCTVFTHHVGASRESSDAAHMLRRLAHFSVGEDVRDATPVPLAREAPDWLTRQGKSLAEPQLARITAHPLSGTPALLAVVVHDLCVSATHESIARRIDEVLCSGVIDDVLEHAIAAAEMTAGLDAVRRACTALVTCRGGLTVDALIAPCSLAPLAWARVEAAIGPILSPAGDLTMVAGGHARQAIRDRFGLQGDVLRDAHGAAVDWWLERGPSSRAAFELPWQLAAAGRLQELRDLLVDRRWIECLLLHLSDGEILSSWKPTGAGAAPDVQRGYEAALAAWQEEAAPPLDGEFLMRLGGFVSHAAGPCALTLSILERAIELARLPQCSEQELVLRRNNRGHEQLILDRAEDATRSCTEALKIRGHILTEGHPHTLGTIDNLGQAHHVAARRDDVDRHMRAALKLRQRHLGDHNADTSTSCNNLAMLLLDGGADTADIPEAGRLFEEAYASSLHAVGARHPETAISVGNSGMFHASHGNESRTRELIETALAIHLELSGRDHEYVAVGRARLDDVELRRGVRARTAGRLADAQMILTSQVTRRAEILGPRKLPWAAAASALAETRGHEGDVATARDLPGHVVKVRKRELGSEHQLTHLAFARLRAIEGSG